MLVWCLKDHVTLKTRIMAAENSSWPPQQYIYLKYFKSGNIYFKLQNYFMSHFYCIFWLNKFSLGEYTLQWLIFKKSYQPQTIEW